MTPLTEDAAKKLIGKCAEHNVAAFEQLVKHFQPFAFALAMRLLANEEDANDVVQESFIRVWKHMDRFDQTMRFTTWLYKIVSNAAIDRLRALKRNRKLFSSHDDPEQSEVADDRCTDEIRSNQDLASLIKSLSGELSLKQRLVFTLRDLQDLPVEEVADIVGVSVGSVKTNLCYARKKIRKLMLEKYHIGSLES